MKEVTKLRLKYVMWSLFASLFVVFGIQNFFTIVKTPGFDTIVMLAMFFLVLDVYLFFIYNSRALACLKALQELKNKKRE